MTAGDQPTGPTLTPASLNAAVQQLLNTVPVPEHHGFAAVADLNGVHAGIATRVGDGWLFVADSGYEWRGAQRGWQAGLTLSKTWS